MISHFSIIEFRFCSDNFCSLLFISKQDHHDPFLYRTDYPVNSEDEEGRNHLYMREKDRGGLFAKPRRSIMPLDNEWEA